MLKKPIVGEYAYYDNKLSKQDVYWLVEVEGYQCLIISHYSKPLMVSEPFITCLGKVTNVSTKKIIQK